MRESLCGIRMSPAQCAQLMLTPGPKQMVTTYTYEFVFHTHLPPVITLVTLGFLRSIANSRYGFGLDRAVASRANRK